VWGGYANLGNYPPFLKKHGLYFSQGIVWGDGSAPQAATLVQGVGGGTVAASYAYAAGGIYTVTVTVTDDDTGEATQTTMSVVVGAGIQNGVLQIVGTSGDDLLNIYRTGTGLVKVHASFFPEGQRDYSEAEVELIHVWLLDGNDHATLAGNVDLPVVMDGGGGNDTLNSTEGPAILLGGIGNDELSGGQGRSILIGGIGQDRIVGGSGENVIIGGTTAYDGNDVALLMLLAEWTSSRSFALRVENLKAGAGPVLGGSGIRLEQDATVLDDSDFDLLTGSAGIDWFLFDDDEDDVTDLKSNEEGS
jgi:Ca2+-binding RTX toxin-like protein